MAWCAKRHSSSFQSAEYIAGSDYTIADISVFPWVTFYKRLAVNPERFGHFMRWLAAIEAHGP